MGAMDELGMEAVLQPARRGTRRFELSIAQGRTELFEAQRLRYQVFAGELGARIDGPFPGIDADLFDAYCEHLVVRDRWTERLVGTYRLLTAEAARGLGRFYCESEFDLVRLDPLRPAMVELGRACVAPEYRSGPVLRLLWSGIGRFLRERGYRYLIGCASIDAHDGGHLAASVYLRLAGEYMAAGRFAARPHRRLPLESTVPYLDPELPVLLKGYLRAGARVCGEPALDEAFGTADLLMLLDVSEAAPRYAERFFGEANAPDERVALPA